MCLVAFQTGRDFPVGLVAGCTEKLGMTGLMRFHFISLLFMARKTWSREICGQFHLQGCVRVRVARAASADLIVRFAGMAHAAGRNDLVLAHHRWVSLVTARAGDGRFVLAALTFDGSLYRGVTLHAIAVRQLSLRFRCLFLRKTFFLVGIVQ